MDFKETFQELPDDSKIRTVFYPLAIAATQIVSLGHFLFIPNENYFTTEHVVSGLILGFTIAATAEIVSRYLSQKGVKIQEKERILEHAANLLTTELYVLELLPDGEIEYKFANDAYRKRPYRAHFRDLSGVKYSEFHSPEDSAAYFKELAEIIKNDSPLEKELMSRSGRLSKKTFTPHEDIATGRKFVFVVSDEISYKS